MAAKSYKASSREMVQESKHCPSLTDISCTGRSGVPWLAAHPPGFQFRGNGRRTKLGQEKRISSSSTTYMKAILLCTGHRIYSSVNNGNNYTQHSQDQQGKEGEMEGGRKREVPQMTPINGKE